MKYRGISIIALIILLPFIATAEEAAREKAPVQAMKAYEQAYDALMENMVNVKTPGYKSLDTLVGVTGKGEIQAEHQTRFVNGSVEQTNSPLDVAIDGPGFFVVQMVRTTSTASRQKRTPMTSGVAYTRDGRFRIDQDGYLVTLVGGYQVMGKGGPITIPPIMGGGDNVLLISPQGSVIQNNNLLGILQVVTVSDMSALERISGSFFRVPANRSDVMVNEVVDVTVRPGYVEASNVDLSRQLVELPLNSRKYDANSKALQIIKKTSQTAREMGRIQ